LPDRPDRKVGQKVSKSKAANQTQEQELAEQIINDLKEWASVGNDNWNSGSFVNELHKQYWPKDCLGYRFSIHNKLWMQPIILKLLGQGRDGLAKRIEQLRDKLDEAVNAYNENLDSTNPAHLVDTGLSMHAGNLIKALEAAKPYLGQQTEQKPAKASGEVDTNLPDYRALNLANRTIEITGTKYSITSEKVWNFIKDLCSFSKDDRIVSGYDGSANNKNAVDQLRKKVGKDNLHKLIIFVKAGYKLNPKVKILYSAQKGIRKTHLKKTRATHERHTSDFQKIS